MAGFQKIYTSENEYLYDLGKTTGYFDEEYYNLAKESGSDYQYLQMMASLKQTGVSDTFDPVLYSKLSGEERFNYLATENFMDKSSEDYTKSSQYFKQREKQIQNEEIYAGLNGFEKTMNSIGGWLGNAFLQLGGVVEGLVDAGATLVGTFGSDEFKKDVKEFIARDTTGYNGAQSAMNDWINKYTFIDKNVVTQAINDVTTGIVRMVPMIAGGILAPYTRGVSAKIGTSIYYASMAGNTSEQAITANPDINYGNLLLYTAGSVGLEALTEWASGKLFGDDLISSLMKGQKYAPTGTLVKTIAKNFGTEALEEAVAELFGSMMYAGLVTGDVNDIASIGDIFYAAIIGGLTGVVMSGGQIATTKRMVVTQDGQLKYRSELTDAELKTAKKLKLSESWGLQSLIQQSQQALSTPDNVTQLMAETGKSVSQLQTENATEYEKAVTKDTETKTQQAKALLDLANLMSTIGVEQFTKSAELLKNNADLATEYVNNFLNHTDVANKKASEVFSANYPGKSFTPTAVPSKPNQALAESLRQVFPQLKVVFGTFGSEDGLPVRAINKGETYLFLDENMVSQKGYQQVLHETIRYQLADQLMQEINILDNAEANGIVKLVTDLDVGYDKLTKEQKLSIAQILCFDPVNSRRLFKGANKTHAKIFNYITDQSEYVKKFGRQTEVNKMRYHDLLEIRDMYIRNIAETISNNEDVQTAKEQYNLTDEETKTKIVDKTETTILNDTIAVMRQNLDENVIARQEAIEDLLQNRIEINKSVPFDWSNLYNETYYNEDWVAQIKQQQQTQDFQEALRAHLIASHKVDFSIIEHSTLVDTIKYNVSVDELNKLAETLFTKEYLDTNPDLQLSVADALYTMVQTEDTDADSIMVKDNQIQGTGKLKFILGEIGSGENLLSQEQRRSISTSAGNVFKRMAPDSAEYSTTKFNNVEVDVQNDSTLDEHQKALLEDCKNKYGLDLHFYKGAINYDGIILDNANGFVSGNNVYLRYDGTLTNEEINNVIDHEVTHRRIDAEPEKYKGLRNVLRKAMEGEEYNKWYETHERLYKEIYKNNEGLIEEEMIVNIVSGIIKPTYHAAYKDVVKPWIGGFKKTSTKLMKKKISTGVKFSVQNKQETSIQQKINKAESPKQIADVITAIIEDAPLEVSETKGYGDEGTRMYKKTSDEMRRKYASLWTKITQENYDKVRNELVKSDYEYADEALLIFDRFTRAYARNSTKFDEATKKKIMEVGSRKQTIAAISQGLQSAELANEHSFGETAAAFEKDGYKVTVSNDTVKEYVPEMANKKEFIKELDKEISNIEEQIKTAETDIDAAELNNQLDKAVEKRIVMSEGTNEEIMDWVIKNEDVVTKASKLQKEVFEQMVDKGELAQKEGKKAVTILIDEKTGLPKPFPKATQFIEKNVKRLKSFRMWAMLTSPVSWVRNWVGNAGMTALDGMTNSLEKFITSKQKVMPQQELAELEKQYQELSRKEKLTDTEKSKLAQLSNQIERNYDFKFVETKASKDLRKQIADDYKDVIQQILNGEDVKYESSAEKAAAITRAERKITRASQNANLGQKLWAACQSMTDWGLNTGWFGDNAVVVNSLVKNFANMVESNKTYLIKSLTTEYGKEGRGMSAERKALVEKALNTKDSMDVVNAMSKYDVTLFMDSCKQRTFEQYFKNSNWLSQWASNLSKKHPIAASLTSLVLPFPKVAANILSMAYKYSPLGFLSAARQWSVVKQMDAAGYVGVRDAFARAKAGRTTAQATVGSFMMLAGLILASLGFIDIDDDDYLGPSLKVGDLKVSLSNLAPSMTTFSVGAAMMWAWKNDQSATLKALDVLYDNTLLGNIENVFRYGDPSKYIENLSINYFSQYVPAMLKLFAKFTTNQEMIDKSGSYFAKLGKTFASGIPGVANLLPKKINPYTGETLTGTGTNNAFFNFIEALSPLDMRFDVKSATQKEAERLRTESSGLSGTFKVNDKEFVVDKVTYSKYRANYIQDNFEKILSGKQKVTVEDENGKRITTTYDKLNDKQKKNVINRLYTEATTMTKIKWWTDQGNKYVVTNRDQYNEYRKMFSNIIYKKTWTKSKFVES